MTGEGSRRDLLALPGARRDCTLGATVAVMKVGGNGSTRSRARAQPTTAAAADGCGEHAGGDDARLTLYCMNLQWDLQEDILLHGLFPAARTGYPVNTRHRNTVRLDDSLPRGEIERMIDNFHGRVMAGLTRRMRRTLDLENTL